MTTTRVNTSIYPLGIDTDKTIPHLIEEISEVRAINFNSLKDAILSVELALGINPQGVYDTVVDRLDAISDDFFAIYVSGLGDTISGPSDDGDGNLEIGTDIAVGMKMLYDDDGDGNKSAKLTFGDECNCSVVLDDRSSQEGTFANPTTSTKWIPTAEEIIDNAAQSVVPLSILGNSALFSEDLDTDDEFGMQVGSNVYFGEIALRMKHRSNVVRARGSDGINAQRFFPLQPSVFARGNLSVDGDLEVQGNLFISDYMNVKAAQTSIDIDRVSVTVPSSEFKTNMLMVTFSAIILDVTENNSRGGIFLKVDGKKIDHPMIYKGQKLTEDDIWDDVKAKGINVFPEAWDTEGNVVSYVDPVSGISEDRDRTEISPNGSYSAMSTMMMISDSSVAGVSLDGTVPRFNPNEDLVITMGSTEGVSSIMHTVVVWSTGATNMEIVSGWNSDGSPIKESWTPSM